MNPKFLERFRQGHAKALEDVYRFFERPLRNFVLRGFAFRSDGRQLYFGGLAQEHDLEDIIQETFRRAFGAKARASYDGIRPYKNYLFTIARNAVITDLSSRKRQIPIGEALFQDNHSDSLTPLESWVVSQRAQISEEQEISSERQVENLEIYGLIMGFVEALEEEEQTFFKIRFLSQCSQENTAKKMGWNRAKVRKLEARLRKAFLSHAKGSGYLDMRTESRKVRRVANPAQHKSTFARSRDIWRTRRCDQTNEFLHEAA